MTIHIYYIHMYKKGYDLSFMDLYIQFMFVSLRSATLEAGGGRAPCRPVRGSAAAVYASTRCLA